MKVGVAGVGHLGAIHLKCIHLSNSLELIGVYDANMKRAKEMAAIYDCPVFENLDDLIDQVEFLDIVTPTSTHHEVAMAAIEKGKHVFIEKPVCSTMEEARELITAQKKHHVKVQIGHVERFNPAILALEGIDLHPKFIEGHRLALFNPRGTDVSVVLDLMIHDLDLILKLIDSKVSDIQSNKVAIVSKSDDICNVRLTFENGSVVNLTASRISMKGMRKLRLFQDDAYISIDMLAQETQIISLVDPPAHTPDDEVIHSIHGPKVINMEMPEIKPVNAIQMELESFSTCIKQDSEPYVSLDEGVRALDLAFKIMSYAK